MHELCCLFQHVSYNSEKHASYIEFVDILQQTCYQQAGIRMRSHGLRQLMTTSLVQVVNRLVVS